MGEAILQARGKYLEFVKYSDLVDQLQAADLNLLLKSS
jgi:hypothetical protein